MYPDPGNHGEAMTLDDWLRAFARGELDLETLKARLLQETYVDAGLARLDTHRLRRTGRPEAVYCAAKTPEQAAAICARLHEAGQPVLATRAGEDHARAILEVLPRAEYDPLSRLLTFHPEPPAPRGLVGVVCAGTSDLPVFEEAARTAAFLGSNVVRHVDCGAAGLHRLLHCLPDLSRARAVIAVAGMDGVLPTLVASLLACPVIGLPTSVGYGAGAGGLAPLLTMLNSCAPGLGVVNIDNGFGAGCLAHTINLQAQAVPESPGRDRETGS
jgi:hypothetical protein